MPTPLAQTDAHDSHDSIRRRFHSQPVPTLTARKDLRHPIVFSHVRSEAAMPAPTLRPPVERAFALHVHHRPIHRGDMWLGGRHVALPRVGDGGLVIFDLQSEPTAQIHEGFEFSRFHLSQSAMDEMAYERGLAPVTALRSEDFLPDPVVKHLALALVQRAAVLGPEKDTLFIDAITLALFAHVAQRYGGARDPANRTGQLLPWQLRRVHEWAQAHLQDAMSIAELAALLDLSPSHFARAFGKSMGVPPHKWVLRLRIERAKQLLRVSAMPLSEVADSCGFVDQSHFSSVFLRTEGTTPGRWRRRLM